MALSNEQQTFVKSEGKVVLCACPGSGKTFTVAHKLSSYLNFWEDKHKGIAVLSFTNVASLEIEKKIKQFMGSGASIKYPHFIGTIDSFLNQFVFLRYAYLLTEQQKRPCLSQRNIKINYKFWRKECHQNGCTKAIQDFRWSIDDQIYRNSKLVTCTKDYYGLPCDQYKNMLIRKGIFFQNDVPYIVYKILRKYPQIAKMLGIIFPIILLDEAQDTSKEQMAILDLIADAGVKTICLVGDPDQAIYEWRNATVSCFIDKINSQHWNTLYLTENRRSSQLICNATKLFSTILKDKETVKAVGDDMGFSQKPELLLIKKDTSKEIVMEYFFEKCISLGIEKTKENIAVLTRGKIHNNTEINNLWKSEEIELLARASYLFKYGSKKEAYNLCVKCLYLMLIGNPYEASHELKYEIENKISYETWRYICVQLLISLPPVILGVDEWVKKLKLVFENLAHSLDFVDGHSVDEVIKIKQSDKNNKDFKTIPVKMFFEKRQDEEVTISSIHGVKGETFEAILLYAPSIKGATITSSGITTGSLDSEHNRAAYVAMTRPRKYLAVVLQKPSKATDRHFDRFPKDSWDYIEL